MAFVDTNVVSHANHIRETYNPVQIAQLVRLIGSVPSCAAMSPMEFEHALERLRRQRRRRAFSERSIQAARLVLVMGASVAEAAEEVGLSRQVVHRLMLRINTRLQALPADWVRVDVWLPASAAQQVVDLANTLRSGLEEGRAAGTVSIRLDNAQMPA